MVINCPSFASVHSDSMVLYFCVVIMTVICGHTILPAVTFTCDRVIFVCLFA